MTKDEQFLIRLLRVYEPRRGTTVADIRNAQAVLLQSFIAEYGPLSEEAAAEVRAILSSPIG